MLERIYICPAKLRCFFRKISGFKIAAECIEFRQCNLIDFLTAFLKLTQMQLRNALVELISEQHQSVNLILKMCGVIKILPYFRKGQSQLLQSAYKSDMHHIVGRIVAKTLIFIFKGRRYKSQFLIIYKNSSCKAQCFCDFPHFKEIFSIHISPL